MTFELKELSKLRSDFDDTVDIILKREKKGKIEDLSNPRKYELQFLSSVLIELETQFHLKPAKTTEIQSTIFYGAMLAIMKDIDNKRGLLNSAGLLSSRLADTIGLTDKVKAENKPNLYQTAKFYTALNEFLNCVFIDKDSRKGFSADHILRAVPLDDLTQLIKTSYKLEKEAQKEIVTSLTTDGKYTPDIDKYSEFKKSPASATDRFGGWDKLTAYLDDLIKDELADKNVSNIDKLSLARASQLHFLLKIKKTLQPSKIEELEKTAILAGAMHLVRQQIITEYSNLFASLLEKSVIYKGLNKLLTGGVVNPQDTESLIYSASQFVRLMTVEPKIDGKKAILVKHIFSEIPGFNLKLTFNLFIDMIRGYRVKSLNQAVEAFKKEHPEKPSSSYWSSLFGSKPSYKEDEDEIEHKSSVTASK